MIAGDATAGLIAALDLAMLEDDRHYFPPYDAVPVVHAATLLREPRIRTALERLAGHIHEADMRSMNYAVEGEKHDPAVVVRQFPRGPCACARVVTHRVPCSCGALMAGASVPVAPQGRRAAASGHAGVAVASWRTADRLDLRARCVADLECAECGVARTTPDAMESTAPGSRSVPVTTCSGTSREQHRDLVAVEAPLEVRVNGERFAVIMRTPGADRPLALGFLFSEHIIDSRADVAAVDAWPGDPVLGNRLNVVLAETRGARAR